MIGVLEICECGREFLRGIYPQKKCYVCDAAPPKREPVILTMKDIDKLHIYFTDREIAHILWFGQREA